MTDKIFIHEPVFSNGVVLLESQVNSHFENLYLQVRKKEGRLFDDETVRSLPSLPVLHPLKKEWALRKVTKEKFLKYISKQDHYSTALDLGCGNGWFTHILRQNNIPMVVGVDVNLTELGQAARVFRLPGLAFVYGDIFKNHFRPAGFDLITLNSTLQYFPDAALLLNKLLSLLSRQGEIHILDTNIYADDDDKRKAGQRSYEYYEKLGFPEMTANYFHHTWQDLKGIPGIKIRRVWNPSSLKSKLPGMIGHVSPVFPWIRITPYGTDPVP